MEIRWGVGTGLAIVGAYVLAGELLRANGDDEKAYTHYETTFRDYAKVSRTVNTGPLLDSSHETDCFRRRFCFKG